jgi:exoribonuclease R
LKSLLIRLTLGLSEQDISADELQYVNNFLAKKYITKKDNIYKFNSKYRAGTLGLIQKGTAYLNVIGENVRDLFIGEGDLGDAKEGDLIIAQRLLGKRGTPSAKIVLAQFNKHDEFDEEVLKIATSFEAVDASKYPKRVDLRELSFCTIDPVTAKDYDDAIYWDDKNTTLFVAIADVSEYVTPFGAIDNEAIYRSFSIYLPHRSIPMLPRQLSENHNLLLTFFL